MAKELATRYHALISCDNGTYFIEDLNSKNGTLVNGVALNGRRALVSGDRLIVGGLEYRFEDIAATKTGLAAGAAPPISTLASTTKLSVDTANLKVRLVVGEREEIVALEGYQWRLFLFLYQNRERVLSREEIIAAVYQPNNPAKVPSNAALDTLVSRLRERLHMYDPTKLPYIKTLRRIGYRLEI